MSCQHIESVETRDGKECRECGIGWRFALKEKKKMKNSKTVYKVVQVVDGKMYSANPYRINVGQLSDQVIEYKMNHLNKPLKHQNPFLFLLPTRKDARAAKRFYSYNKNIKILRGTATMVEPPHFNKLLQPLPSDFNTVFGATFFPTEVIY